MKSMILAAGRGERLRPLTDTTPKPLIKAAGKSLIEYHIENLKKSGINEIIINTAWLAEVIHQQLGDGSRYNVTIYYSDEDEALETAGGIIKALPLLGKDPFLVVNGDIWCDYDFSRLPTLDDQQLAHLILVDNPAHNPDGDFGIENGLITNTSDDRFTFSGIGLYTPEFFKDQPTGALPLAPIIRKKAQSGLVSAAHHQGLWTDVGTVERLHDLETVLTN